MSQWQPIGYTNISRGTEIGWQLLTPNQPYELGLNPTSPNVSKILILLTDGVQTMPAMGPSGEVSVTAANDTTAELCTNIKAAKTTIFTIAYNVDDPAAY